MERLNLPIVAWFVFLAAAALEVGGDAIVRKGLRGGSWGVVGVGGLLLGTYGLVVNQVPWDFSRLLGVYVAVFAVTSVLAGFFFFQEAVPLQTWVGLAVIVLGGLIIQFSA